MRKKLFLTAISMMAIMSTLFSFVGCKKMCLQCENPISKNFYLEMDTSYSSNLWIILDSEENPKYVPSQFLYNTNLSCETNLVYICGFLSEEDIKPLEWSFAKTSLPYKAIEDIKYLGNYDYEIIEIVQPSSIYQVPDGIDKVRESNPDKSFCELLEQGYYEKFRIK